MKGVKALCLREGQNLALNFSHVPYSLGSGRSEVLGVWQGRARAARMVAEFAKRGEAGKCPFGFDKVRSSPAPLSVQTKLTRDIAELLAPEAGSPLHFWS